MKNKHIETRDNLVYESLRAEILSNQFSPGELLRQEELCLKMNVTRTPLRMALRRLEQEKLVVNDPYKGASVRKVNSEEFVQIFDIREVLEGLAARKVASVHDKDGIAALRGIAERCDEAMEKKQWTAFFEQDKTFHRELILQSNNIPLAETMEIIDFHLRTFSLQRHYVLFVVEQLSARTQGLPLCHRALVDVLESREATLAEEKFRYHVRLSKQMISAAHHQFLC